MNTLYAIGDKVTFQWGNTQKDGIILVVDAHGTFECQGLPSYDILVESENVLYKHVRCDFIVCEKKNSHE